MPSVYGENFTLICKFRGDLIEDSLYNSPLEKKKQSMKVGEKVTQNDSFADCVYNIPYYWNQLLYSYCVMSDFFFVLKWHLNCFIFICIQ